MLNRRQFLAATPAVLGALASAPRFGHGAESVVPLTPPKVGLSTRTRDIATAQPGRLTTRSAKVCKILQVTDLHQFNQAVYVPEGADDLTFASIRKMVEREQPDLLVASGDLWHDNPQGRGKKGAERLVKELSTLGVPWTMCWGNHDLLDNYQEAHDEFEKAANSVYRAAETHGDCRVEVRAQGTAVESQPVLDLYFLNSGAENLTLWQVEAFRKMSATVGQQRPAVPALAYFHIPILEYETKVTPTSFKGTKYEGVGKGKDDGAAFKVIAAPNTVRACFCGHNHTNDYVVTTGSVDLVYGRSSGYAGYGGDRLRKGGKLVEVDLATGKYTQTTVFPDGGKSPA